MYFKDYSELVDGHFFVFYDKNQLLTTVEVPKWITNSECKLLLTRNCRNTYEIALTSYNIIDIPINKKIMMVNGYQTSICFIKGEPIMRIAKLLKMLTSDDYGYDYSDIVILSLKTEENSILTETNKYFCIQLLVKTNSSVFFTTATIVKAWKVVLLLL